MKIIYHILSVCTAAFFCTAFWQPVSAQQYSEYYFKAAGTPAEPKVSVSWNRYHTNAGLEKIGRELENSYPQLVKMESIGRSVGGRDIWMLTISDFTKGDPDRKPAMWIDGNIHGNEIQCSEMSLYTAWYLVENFAENAFIRELLAERTFYIAPTINPDGRAVFTEGAGAIRSGILPLDNDRDGTADEDDVDDLNGDGFITQMRRKNPNGRYLIDPTYPNRLIPAKPDQKGEYELLGMEGIDNDGDGLINEDGVGGYDPNRDWGFGWEPNFIQRGAMKYPFSLPETRAVADFIVSHPNIAALQSFHNSGGWFLRSPGVGSQADRINNTDLAVLDAIGKKGEVIVPHYGYVPIFSGLYSLYGGSIDWVYFGRGIFTFSNELWSHKLMFEGTPFTGDRETLYYEFDKTLLYGDAFVPWEEYDHPQYGKIEIGGFKKNYQRLHPGFLLESDSHRNAAFLIYHAWNMPLLSVSDVREKDLGGGIKEITAYITNYRLMPTHSNIDVEEKINRPDWVSIQGPQVLAGIVLTNADLNQGTEQCTTPEVLQIKNIPGNSTVAVRWIVKGNGSYTITVDSAKGGTTNYTR